MNAPRTGSSDTVYLRPYRSSSPHSQTTIKNDLLVYFAKVCVEARADTVGMESLSMSACCQYRKLVIRTNDLTELSPLDGVA
jgi:hypothetical protein